MLDGLIAPFTCTSLQQLVNHFRTNHQIDSPLSANTTTPTQQSRISRIANSIFNAVKSCGSFIGGIFKGAWNVVSSQGKSLAERVTTLVKSIFSRPEGSITSTTTTHSTHRTQRLWDQVYPNQQAAANAPVRFSTLP